MNRMSRCSLSVVLALVSNLVAMPIAESAEITSDDEVLSETEWQQVDQTVERGLAGCCSNSNATARFRLFPPVSRV